MRLDRTKFVSWLRAKPPAEIVGEHRSCRCPIAKFYHDTSGGHEIVIFERWGEYFIDRGFSKRPLPEWASDFVIEVDGDLDGHISAQRALAALSTTKER